MVSHQNLFGINGNHGHKTASRICQGAATPSFGPMDQVSYLGPLGARPGFGFSLDYSIKNSFIVHQFVRPQLREFNHSSANWLRSFLFLLVFFVVQVGISLLGEVNLVRDLIDN